MGYGEILEMPIDEFFAVIECANVINVDRKKEMEKSKRG